MNIDAENHNRILENKIQRCIKYTISPVHVGTTELQG